MMSHITQWNMNAEACRLSSESIYSDKKSSPGREVTQKNRICETVLRARKAPRDARTLCWLNRCPNAMEAYIMRIPETMQIMPARMNSNMKRPEFKPKMLKNSLRLLNKSGRKSVKKISSKARMMMERI